MTKRENLWNNPGIPKKGWVSSEVIDYSAEYGGYASCEMCGKEHIRYVHIMEHPEHDNLGVGCVCAEKMSGDYEGPKLREKALKAKVNRKREWVSRDWRMSSKGNPYRNVNGVNVGIHKISATTWGFRVGSEFSRGRYPTPENAKSALFDHIYGKKIK
jgi:hypothetical protein